MQNMNLNLSESKNKIENNGWENIGIMYKFISKKKLKPVDVSIFMILVEYSFGYKKVNANISNKQLCELSSVSDKTVTSSISRLIDKNLISRIKWQNHGPKQAYTYRVCYPDRGNISLNTNKKENEDIKNVIEAKELEESFNNSL